MSPRKHSPVSGPRVELQSPFADLSIPGLPEGTLREDQPVHQAPGRIFLRKEKAHRGGKPVVVAAGFHEGITAHDLERIASDARKRLGCGGTVRDREMEFQGDNAAAIRKILEAAGFRVDGV